MDAAEADLDARLYKASGDLIRELQVKLPLLIWHDGKKKKRLRTHVPYGKSNELAHLAYRFQEWPQLLDPVLSSLVGTIVDGFTTYITTCPETYTYQAAAPPRLVHVVPLPTALCSLLYAFCKVRGYKVIVRLLNNEPRYVAPMLSCVRRWENRESAKAGAGMVWQEKYIMLLWLSHLMLAPFELSTLSTSNTFETDARLQSLTDDLPEVARDVLSIAYESLSSPSKERESAVILLVRLALRRDMQKLDLAARLVDYSTRCLLDADVQTKTIYHMLGHLALLYSIVNLGTSSEVVPFLAKVYHVTSQLAFSDSKHHDSIRDSAPARKLLLKVLRVCIVHAIPLTHVGEGLERDTVASWLEDSIQYFLDCLGDKETPVRMSASKALSIVALKLDFGMAAEIVEVVLGALSENVLLEDPSTGKVMAKTELPDRQTTRLPRNMSAVNPLRWHGHMLTLGHLLFRRSPPPYQLPDIIEALLLGLEFEQRSSVGTSLGVGVRDGACFGIWALARKYSTRDLEAIINADVPGVELQYHNERQSILQLLATRLVLSACLDPSGNIRRGSSAALQELIGRHPDIIAHGIPLVQVIDYTAVARRSRAMIEVAVQAASLDPAYHEALLIALLGWRGAKAADAESRRWASVAMRMLFVATQLPQKVAILLKLRDEVYRLGSRNLGSSAGARHGLLLCAAALLDSVLSSSPLHAEEILSKLDALDLTKLTGSLDGRATADLEIAMEGVSTFIESMAQSKSIVAPTLEFERASFVYQVLPVIDRCVIIGEKPLSVEAASRAIVAVFPLIVETDRAAFLERWLSAKQQKHTDLVCKGRLRALASLHNMCTIDELGVRIMLFFEDLVTGNLAIEVKTSAMDSLCALLRVSASQGDQSTMRLCDTIISGLTDYTNDQRGDIGSLLRLQSLGAVEVLHSTTCDASTNLQTWSILTPFVVRLAAAKLTKVRYQAWLCLRKIWRPDHYGKTLAAAFDHLEDVSTEEYYLQLLELLTVGSLRGPLLLGLCSAIGGSDDVNRACCSAFTSMALKMEGDEQRLFTSSVVWLLSTHMNKTAPGDDHDILPAIDFLTFLLDQGLVTETNLNTNGVDIWDTVQKVHIPTSSIERTGAVLRLCNALQSSSAFRTKASDKLTRQLLHRYPKVRNAAADALYTSCHEENLLRADWNAPSASNKPIVLELRKTLRVATAAAS